MPLPDRQHLFALQSALLGRYSVERKLGQGGMGTVYLARDLRLDRLVAIKMLHPELARLPDARERFLREARIAARLSHPHIVPVYSVEEGEDHACIMMAFVDGETLAERLHRRGALAAAEAERLLREVAWALGYAHASGVLHRDLTPANVLLERESGRALLADFGLATAHDAVEGDPVFGTPGYLAPEVIRGEMADHRSDLYALGAIGYGMLAGRPPHTAETTGELLAKHLVQPVVPLERMMRGASRRLMAAVMSCLEKDPDARPSDAATLLATLDRIPEPVAVAPPLAAWFTRWERIRPIYAMATPILGMQTWALVWGYFQSGRTGLAVAAVVSTALTLTAIPVLAHLTAEALALRQLNGRGFGIADIRAAWPHWTEALERAHAREGLPPLAGRVLFDLTALAAIALVLTFAVVMPVLRFVLPSAEVGSTIGALAALGSVAYLGMTVGLGIGFIAPGIRFHPRGRFRRLTARFWDSRFAAVVTRAAAWGQRDRLEASSTLHRNTELVLGLALDSLWDAMPAALREGLGNLPELAGTLRLAAEELRDLATRLGESEDALASSDPDESARLGEIRADVEARQREVVAMLERLRLQLLRSLADRRTTDALTSRLDEARTLEGALVREIAAHRDLRALLDQHAAPRLSTPWPSPADA
jgi:serine/threonine-protein kinase